MSSVDIGAVSRELLEARDHAQLVDAVSATEPAFSVDEAYQVARLNHDALLARGEQPIGRKIGFTNRGIWPEYGVYQPIWAHVYASTVAHLKDDGAAIRLERFCQPRIEPEIVFKFARPPRDPDPLAIADCVEWVAHGFEIVHSHSPRWKFTVADTIADFGLHGALLIGAPMPAGRLPGMLDTLSRFQVELMRDGQFVDRGIGSNVLDGPLQAVAHLVAVLAKQERFPLIAAGEIVTTGTLTAAWPVAPGQVWQTALEGISLSGIKVRFA